VLAGVNIPAVRNIRLVVEYDGTDFHGWQIQPRDRTVQGELETAVEKMTGTRQVVRGASRTDAGVHAAGQVATFETDSTIPTAQFAPGLTTLSGYDVVVLEAEEVPLGWNPRSETDGKTYTYQVLNRLNPSPIHRRTSWHVAQELDLEAMRAGTEALVGKHDFAAFRSSSCTAPTTVRQMRAIEVVRREDELVELRFKATAFLQHMVRILVGTLVEVGKGRLAPDEVARIRDSLDRAEAGQTAPAHGLCLLAVHF